jgi:thiosulfate reductase cytochrome b subunit
MNVMSSVDASTVAASAETIPAERIVVLKHHWLVRLTHWVNLAVLAALIASGLSIYWASPVFLHAPNPKTGTRDYVGDVSFWLSQHVPFTTPGPIPRDWLYNRLGVGTFALAQALQLHWLFAYVFMLIGVLYLAGLIAGGGWRSLVPRRTDAAEALAMIRYYVGLVPMKLLRRSWPHPHITTKYNALQRAAYASMPLFGALAIASGWAMHKPAQLGWLERLFGSYDGARIVHFAAMLVFMSFVIPHVILVLADGWDTMRSMITGWSDRLLPGMAGDAAVVPASVIMTVDDLDEITMTPETADGAATIAEEPAGELPADESPNGSIPTSTTDSTTDAQAETAPAGDQQSTREK